MSLFGSHTREQLRQTYADAWGKRRAGAPLTPLEALISDVIALHPEYHGVVEDPARLLSAQSDPAGAAENPFLHMGLHLAVREQLSIDRPPGIRELAGRFEARVGTRHDAEHALMDALAETLWEAQRAGRAPDEGRYLALAWGRLADWEPRTD
jgi:hypothetical protein